MPRARTRGIVEFVQNPDRFVHSALTYSDSAQALRFIHAAWGALLVSAGDDQHADEPLRM
jgi:hypothetical protein